MLKQLNPLHWKCIPTSLLPTLVVNDLYIILANFLHTLHMLLIYKKKIFISDLPIKPPIVLDKNYFGLQYFCYCTSLTWDQDWINARKLYRLLPSLEPDHTIKIRNCWRSPISQINLPNFVRVPVINYRF